MFVDRPDSSLTSHIGGGGPETEAQFEIAVRRWLQAEPAAALEIIKISREKKWPPSRGQLEPRSAGPSTELLMIWAKVDLPAITHWAESLDLQKDNLARKAKGLLMSRVDAATRQRWLAEAARAKPDDELLTDLLSAWAGWDPKSALDAALATKNADTIERVGTDGAYGPGDDQPFNSSHFGMGVIKDFDVASLPERLRRNVISEWGIAIMEQWGDIDVGEAARYGLDFMLRNKYAPRQNLLKLFSGDDRFASDSDMIDRTFCALRVWAVVKPDEMKAWIATLKDAEMRKALTWLLENPLGTGRRGVRGSGLTPGGGAGMRRYERKCAKV